VYRLNDQQIDHIINDIRARGVEMESLQNDLLDHVVVSLKISLKKAETSSASMNQLSKPFTRRS